MIRSLRIDNFKALNHVTFPFAPFTVMIGNNAAGKSSLLQAVDFLKYCCTSHVEKFLSDRGLSALELCSKYSGRRNLHFLVEMEIGQQEIEWELVFAMDRAQNNFRLLRECVWTEGGAVLNYDQRIRLRKADRPPRNYRWNAETEDAEQLMIGSYDNSFIRFIDVEKDSGCYPELAAIKKFFLSLEVLDLLSPSSMRGSSQGKADTLGFSGEKLGSFVKGLSPAEREALIADVREFAGPITAIIPKTKQYGWVHLETKEQYGDRTISLGAGSASDGLLRIIAFCCLRYLKKESGAILLDEIEDGINNESLERLVQLLMRIQREKGVQIIATTHSTVLLDYIADAGARDPDGPGAASILFLHRDQDGKVIVRDMLASPAIQEKLAYMYPGEIVLNMTNEELSKALEPDSDGEA